MFADIEGILYRESFTDHTGAEFRISIGFIDSGGTRKGWQKHSRTVEIYEWCSRNRVMMPLKGVHGSAGEVMTFKTIQTYPGTNTPIPSGLVRANIRVSLFKDEMSRLLAKEPDEAGALSFHCEIDSTFAKHFTAETKNELGEWIHDRKIRNDHFDCTGYALALREMIKGRIPSREEQSQPQGRRVRSSGIQ